MLQKFTIVAILALLTIAGCGKNDGELARYESRRELLGTFVTITIWSDNEARAVEAGEAAFNQFELVNRLMSTFREDSEISLLNREASQREVQVSPQTFHMLEQSVHFSKLTGGAFDVTIMPLINLWRNAQRSGALPDEIAVIDVLPAVNYRNIQLNEGRVRFGHPGVKVDLGAIAKGYAADLALATLREHGITAALVNAGGDITAMGSPPGAAAWRVGIQQPENEGHLPQVLHLADQAVATSGDYERYFEIGGKRYSHIIDPRTGQPVFEISSVTVIAPNGTTADALATAFSVLGADKSLELAEQLADVEAMFIVRSATEPEGRIVQSSGFAALTISKQ